MAQTTTVAVSAATRTLFREARFMMNFAQSEGPDRNDADWEELHDWFRSLVQRIRAGDPEADVLAELAMLVADTESY